jgi:hypothetical protein
MFAMSKVSNEMFTHILQYTVIAYILKYVLLCKKVMKMLYRNVFDACSLKIFGEFKKRNTSEISV